MDHRTKKPQKILAVRAHGLLVTGYTLRKLILWIDPCDAAQIITLKAYRIAQAPDRNSAILQWPALIRQMTLRTITDLARSLKNELGMIHSDSACRGDSSP